MVTMFDCHFYFISNISAKKYQNLFMYVRVIASCTCDTFGTVNLLSHTFVCLEPQERVYQRDRTKNCWCFMESLMTYLINMFTSDDKVLICNARWQRMGCTKIVIRFPGRNWQLSSFSKLKQWYTPTKPQLSKYLCKDVPLLFCLILYL